MYVDNYEFKDWMQKLLDKLEEVGKDVKSLQTDRKSTRLNSSH